MRSCDCHVVCRNLSCVLVRLNLQLVTNVHNYCILWFCVWSHDFHVIRSCIQGDGDEASLTESAIR